MPQTSFSERLRDLRERSGLTQQDLARVSGIPLGSLRNYEQGQREPYWDVVFRLAKALGVSCDSFEDCVPGPQPEKLRDDAKGAARPRGRPRKAEEPAVEEPPTGTAKKPRKKKEK